MRVSQAKSREAAGGLTLAAGFLTGLTVIPGLLFQAGMDFTAAYMALGAMTVLSSAWLALRGLPLIAMPSVSMIVWLSYVVIISKGCSWQELLGLSAVISLIGWWLFSLPRGKGLLASVSGWLRRSLSLGLGLMLMMQGLVQGRLILASPWSVTMTGNFQDPLAYWSLLGILLGAVLLAGRFAWALGASFLLTAVFTYLEGFWVLPAAPGLLPEGMEKVLGQAVIWGPWSEAHLLDFVLLGFIMLLTVNVESFCIWQATPQGDEKLAAVLGGLSGFSLLGALLGCLPLSLSPLSAVGWEAGGRKGRTVAVALVVLAVLWLLEPAVAELAKFPAMTVPLMVLSGAMLIRQHLRAFTFGGGSMEEFLPGLMGAVLMALSFNITAGVGLMVFGRALLFAAAGRHKELGAPDWGMALLFFFYFMVSYL